MKIPISLAFCISKYKIHAYIKWAVDRVLCIIQSIPSFKENQKNVAPQSAATRPAKALGIWLLKGIRDNRCWKTTSHHHREDTHWSTCGIWDCLWSVSAQLCSFPIRKGVGFWRIQASHVKCTMSLYNGKRGPPWSSLCSLPQSSLSLHLPPLPTLITRFLCA